MSAMALKKIHAKDPRKYGLPEILAIAHVAAACNFLQHTSYSSCDSLVLALHSLANWTWNLSAETSRCARPG